MTYKESKKQLNKIRRQLQNSISELDKLAENIYKEYNSDVDQDDDESENDAMDVYDTIHEVSPKLWDEQEEFSQLD